MSLYRSKQPINTDKQFIFTCDADMSTNNFLIAFGLSDLKQNPGENLTSFIEKMKATVAVDATNDSLPHEYTHDTSKKCIIKNEVTEENKTFAFLDKECVWLGPIKLQSEDKKVYERITSYNGEKDTYIDENNITYAAAPADKYSIDSQSNYCKLNDDKVVVTSSYENAIRQNNIKYDTAFEYKKKKIKLTISKNGIVSLYEQTNNDYSKLSDFKFSYNDKNNMYLYILDSQNVLSNSAVSFVESNETS